MIKVQHKWKEIVWLEDTMQNKERAKLFMPFDALKGFRECLRLAEKNISSKKTISDLVPLPIMTPSTLGACTPSLYWFMANIILIFPFTLLTSKSTSL